MRKACFESWFRRSGDSEQLAAVKNIRKLDDSKRKILLDQISAKLFQVLLVTNHWTKLISHSEQSNHGLKIVLGTRR